ncbi:MAG: helix-turn-helix transcriptional regulator [Microlunatus sp.]|nr:helix-turn-helix transcriptional regulator [Microlunatus sp.]
MTEEVGLEWKLREVMASRGLFATTDLMPLLEARGVRLSATQVYRLVTQAPERLNMRVLAAACDALECTPAELIKVVPAVQETPRRRAAGASPVPRAAPDGRVRRPSRVSVHRTGR